MISLGPDVKGSDPDVTEGGPAAIRLPKTLRRFLRVGGRVLAAGCLLGLVLFGILQSDRVSTWAVTRLAGRFNPYPGTRLTVDHASGSWIRSLRLEGIRLVPEPGSVTGGPELTLDTLALRYRLLPLLVRRLEIRVATVSGLQARVTQRPDSLWDILQPFQGGDEPATDEGGGPGFFVRTGPIRIRDSGVSVTFAPGTSSAAPNRMEVEELTLILDRLELGEAGLGATVDTLHASFLPPGEILDRVSLEGSGSLEDRRVVIPGLTLRSGLSDVSAQGTLLLPRGEEGEIEAIDFHLRATPLAFRDLSGFIRTLDPAVSAQAELRVEGRSSLVDVSGQGTLSTGGRVEVDGTFSPSASGPVEYRLQATVEGVELESVLGSSTIGGVLAGQVAVDLEGRDLAHLSGELSARVEGLLLAGRGTRGLSVSGGLLDGEAKLEVEGETDGVGAVRLAVGGRPLDPDPTLQVRGDFLQDRSGATSMGNLLEEVGLRGMEAGFSLRTEGFSVDSASAGLVLEIRGGSYRNLSLAGGTLDADWSGGVGTFRLSQPVGTGRVATRGEVRWRDDPPSGGESRRALRYSIPALELEALDLSRLLGDTLPSRVNALASVEGTGFDLPTLGATAQIRFRESEFRGVVFDSALVRPSLEAGAFAAFAEGWVGGAAGGESQKGRVGANLHGRPFDVEPFLVVDSLVFSGIDLRGFGGITSSLNGIVHLRMDGLDPRTGNFTGQVTLLPSRIQGTSIDGADVELSLALGEMRLTGRVLSPDGTLRLEGSASPFAEPAGFHLETAEIRELNLQPFLRTESLHTDLNLDLSFAGSGSSLASLEGSGILALLPSALNQGTLGGGSVALEAMEGRGSVRGEIRTGEGEVTLQATASLSDGLDDLSAATQLTLPDLAAFLGRVDSEMEAIGNLAVSRTPNVGLEFAADLRGRIDAATIDTLALRGSLGIAALRLDTLLVRSEILVADGSGRYALRDREGEERGSDLRLSADLLDLSPLGHLLGLGEVSAKSGRGQVLVTGQPGAASLAASLDLGPWHLKSLSGDSARVTLDYRTDDLVLTTWIREPGSQGTIDLALQADPRAEERRGTLGRLEVITPANHWNLDAPVPFSWKDGTRIDGFVLSSGQGRISVDGSIDPRGTQDLTLKLEEASLSGMARVLGLENLTLLADGDMTLTGPAASPVAEGDLRLKLANREEASTSVDTRFSLAGGALTLGARAVDPSGGVLTLDGSLPLPFSLAQGDSTTRSEPGDSSVARQDQGAVDLTLRSEAFDISWIRGLLPPEKVTALEGMLSADVRATGPFDSPVLEGRIGLSKGAFRPAVSSTRYDEIEFSAEVGNNEIRITRASATAGAGTASIQGVLAFQGFKPGDMDLTARFDRFLAWSTPLVRATLTGDLSLRGSMEEPLLQGNLGLEGSKIELDDVSAGSAVLAVDLTEEDYRMLEDYFGVRADRGEAEKTQLPERFGVNLALHFDRDVWVNRARQPRVSLEVRGDLELTKEPGGEIRVVGTVETLPERSYFRQFGRRFAVREGELSLTGDLSEFSFRMDAVWEVPSHTNPDEAEVTVDLEVVGDAESLTLTLSSEPAMDEADIVSYLATGKSQNALGASDVDASGLGASMAMGAMAGVLEGLASDAVELDVVEIKIDPVKGGATLIAGRYMSPDLYLGFRQPVTFSESTKRARSENQYSEVELEYRWVRWLTMNVQGGASEIRFYLKARYAY